MNLKKPPKPQFLPTLKTLGVGESASFYKAKAQCVRNAALEVFGIGGYRSKKAHVSIVITRLR